MLICLRYVTSPRCTQWHGHSQELVTGVHRYNSCHCCTHSQLDLPGLLSVSLRTYLSCVKTLRRSSLTCCSSLDSEATSFATALCCRLLA